MNYKFLNTVVFFSIVSFLFTACIKNNVVELKEQGTTFLKFLESPANPIFFEPFSDTKEVSLFSLRRDAHSNASLNTSFTVTVRVDTAAITAYNDDNDTEFEVLPDSLYTLGAGITKTGNLTYQMTFQPGEAAKEFTINLNGGKWDFSNKYAMSFVIQDPGGVTISSGKESVITLISVINKYDGAYRLTGYHTRPTLDFPYDQTMHLVTEGTNSVVFYWPAAGSEGHPIGTGPGTVSWYGTAVRPVIVFDENDIITNVYNKDAAVTITRFDAATGSNVSRYDEATKTIIVHWNYNNNPERAFFDTLVYIGPRF
jgi:hypothetical protein